MPGESARINGRKGGRPKGIPARQAMEKEEIRRRIRELVSQRLDGLVAGQIAQAEGLKYLVKRDPKTGKFERIGADGIRDGKGIEVWEKDPSTAAFTDLLNRAADKPTEHQEVTHGLDAAILERLDAWKKPK